MMEWKHCLISEQFLFAAKLATCADNYQRIWIRSTSTNSNEFPNKVICIRSVLYTYHTVNSLRNFKYRSLGMHNV